MLIEEFIESSNKAGSVEELFESFRGSMERLGFDRLIFSLMTDHDFIQREAGHGIVRNYSDDWMTYYMSRNYDRYDPVRRNMYAATGCFVWSDLMKLPIMTDKQHLLMNEGKEAGLKDGLGIPLRGPRGALAGIGAASSSGGIDFQDKNMISFVNLICQQFYTVFLELECQRVQSEVDVVFLTDREQEIMRWCARGYTRPEISEALKISESTIQYHMNNALKKLGASNVTLGVLKALHRGLIQL